MGVPQILVIAMYAVSLLIYANEHGKRKTGKTNFWTGLVGTAIQVGLLVWGGFFGR